MKRLLLSLLTLTGLGLTARADDGRLILPPAGATSAMPSDSDTPYGGGSTYGGVISSDTQPVYGDSYTLPSSGPVISSEPYVDYSAPISSLPSSGAVNMGGAGCGCGGSSGFSAGFSAVGGASFGGGAMGYSGGWSSGASAGFGSLVGDGSAYGYTGAVAGGLHQRHPYFSYRRPWYTPGPASQNVTIVW